MTKEKLIETWKEIIATAKNKDPKYSLELFRGVLKNKEKEMLDDEIKWLKELLKLVLWHNERSLLPYDWFDYEHPRILGRLSKLTQEKEK